MTWMKAGGAESPPQAAAEIVREPVRPDKKSVRTRPKTVRGQIRQLYGFKLKSRESVRNWTEKYPDFEKYERYRWLKRLLMAVCTGAAVWSIYTRQAPRTIILDCCMAAAALIGFDCGRLWSRILADYSRLLIALAFLAWAWSAVLPVRESIMIAAAWSAFTIAAVALCNLRWLSAQVYRRSETIKKALAKTEPGHIDELWQATGAKAVRSFWWEIGVEADNEIYEAAKKGTWAIGYIMGGTVKADTIQQIKELEADNAWLRDQLDQADRTIEEALDFEEDREGYMQEMRELRAQLATAQELNERHADYDRIFSENCRLEAQVLDLQLDLEIAKKDLTAAAEALADQAGQAAETEAAPVLDDKAVRDLLLLEAAGMGYGVTKAAKHAGCSHWQAQQWYDSHKDEVAAGKAEKVRQAKIVKIQAEA